MSVVQKDEKNVSVAVPMESSSSNESAGAAKEDSSTETHYLNGYGYTQKLKEPKAKKKVKAGENAKKSGSAKKKTLVSVPWRVPHSKRGDKHPGFNLDYSPPKTHPPSHN